MTKKKLYTLLTAMTLSFGASSVEGIASFVEPAVFSGIPENLSVKEVYKKKHKTQFRDENTIFAEGCFDKKFTLRTPYGAMLSSTRLYELLPNHHPLLVIRDHDSCVLGYIELKNIHQSGFFNPLQSTTYDRNGNEVLSIEFSLISNKYRLYSSNGSKQHVIAISNHGEEDELLVKQTPHYADANVDPVLFLSVLHIHSSKSLLKKLTKYLATDDIDINDLKAYADATDGIPYIKDAPISKDRTSDIQAWLSILQSIESENIQVDLTSEEKEQIAEHLLTQFAASDNLLATLQAALPYLSDEEKVVVADLIRSQLGLKD